MSLTLKEDPKIQVSEELQEQYDEMVNKMIKQRMDHIEAMTAAYYMMTGIPPHKVELVEEWQGDKVVWYFRKKKKEKRHSNP